MSKGENLKLILQSLLDLYTELLGILKEEREALVSVDIDKLSKITETKQYASLKIKSLSDDLKRVLSSCGAENITQWLLLCSEGNIDDIRVLNGKLERVIEKFNRDSEINAYIAGESISFFNGILNMYASFSGRGEVYNKDATVKMDQHALSVRV